MTRYKQIITPTGTERVAFTSEEETARDAKEAATANGVPASYFAELREKRNEKLASCDWTQSADSPLSSDKKTEWATYRTKLRDFPTTLNNTSVVNTANWNWPAEPS
jgi:hypothetical protein